MNGKGGTILLTIGIRVSFEQKKGLAGNGAQTETRTRERSC